MVALNLHAPGHLENGCFQAVADPMEGGGSGGICPPSKKLKFQKCSIVSKTHRKVKGLLLAILLSSKRSGINLVSITVRDDFGNGSRLGSVLATA